MVRLPNGAMADPELASLAWSPETPPPTQAEEQAFLLDLLAKLKAYVPPGGV